MGDGGYLILSGTYAANKTDNIPVTYKVPFKPAGNETGNYIEVAHNHRYMVKITDADEYHLDFTLNVADWTDEGTVDNYKPDNDFSKDALALADAGNSAEVKLLADGRGDDDYRSLENTGLYHRIEQCEGGGYHRKNWIMPVVTNGWS